jgi:large subunit ribosomal protein L22
MSAAAATKQFVARHRFARLAARKARLAADQIRGLDVNQAIETLEFNPRRSAAFVLKVLKSAVANASQDENVNINRLYVCDSRADDGPLHMRRLRWRPGPQGRAMPFRKRTSHLTVVVREREERE